MNELQQKLLAAFQVEHRDHLEVARRMLDDLEGAGWRPDVVDLVELHRRLHSLKGAARAVDLRPVEALAHRLESVISSCQTGRTALDATTAGILRLAFDAIEDAVASMDAGGQVTLPADAIANVESLLATADDESAGPADSVPAAGPDAEPPPAGEVAQPEETGRPTPLPHNPRIDAGNLDALFESSVEVLTATTVQHRLGAELQALEHEIKEAHRVMDALRRSELHRPKGGGAGVVDLARMRQVQALDAWIHGFEGRFREFGSLHQANGRRLRQLGRRLEGQVRRLRLIPADTVFGGMRKMVRDLAADQGKAVRVDVRGLEALADRTVLQSLRDPVMHVLRNAVTHGVETPEERVAAGRPREGRIVLEMAARGGRLVVRVEDDGHGIDMERVRRAVVAHGLHPADAALPSDPKALTALLSEPGVSTVETVNELAGRGIGLSVVATAVARMLGEFTIRPGADAGTVVTLSVPVSLSSTRLVIVQCRDQTYGIPLHGVERLHRVHWDRVESMEGRPVTRIDDAGPLRLVSLHRLLGDEHAGAFAGEAALPVVVLRSRVGRIGVVVDALVAVQDGVVHDLGVRGEGPVTGGIVTETGTVVPVLDVQTLTDAAAGGAFEHPMVRADRGVERTSPSILVVDDSITTRTLERSILEANGFRVRLSVDGVDALEQLRMQSADLVISDIEMPRMDGFELLRAMKRDAAFAAIPVILVTSRSSDEDRRRGLSLGADAYVVKQRFDQTDLLTTIGQLL